MSSLIPDVAALERRLAGLTVAKHPAREVVLNGRFKDGKAALPQEWRCGGHQGWSADCQPVSTRLGVSPSGRSAVHSSKSGQERGRSARSYEGAP